ncbi:AAA family ATPase [Chitiniphilus purpureus]|uniref:AAA family ATPase n=1 Tax=Chitiniphilus purpureus TaxID=2981137 RepID=A0ABY6DPJ6_9NEIS|nr:AAA family ATPase [Chitiniphilus sp. CD1]UXY16279.1 AAA family ATPase [Chitiniphilus sp. CD1]
MNPQPLALCLLGAPRLTQGDHEPGRELRYRKAWALLGLLSFPAGTWQPRSTLAAMLWPELDRALGLANLRQVLNNLQRVFDRHAGGACLRIERERVLLVPGTTLWVDTLALAQLARRCADDPAMLRADELAQVIEPQLDTLSGTLLDGLEPVAGEAYLRWLQASRQQVQSWQQSMLQWVCEAQQHCGRLAAAVLSARLLWQHDPLSEPAAGRLIRLLLHMGDHRGAQQALTELDRNLRSELGTRVTAALRALVEQRGLPTGDAKTTWPATATVQESRSMAVCFVTLAEVSTDPGDLDLTTLLAARTLLLQRRAEVRPLAGLGFYAGFGEAGQTEQAARRCVLAVGELLKALPGRLQVGMALGVLTCRYGPEGADWFGTLPDEARQLAARALPGSALGNPALAAQVPAFTSASHGVLALRPEAASGDAPLDGRQPLVGREPELAALMRHWRQACDGRPAWVAIQGEAGVGKTRLAREFAAQVATQGGLVLRLHGALEWQSLPLAPLRAALLTVLTADPAALGERAPVRAAIAALLAGQPDCEELLETLLHFLFEEDLPGAPTEGRDQRFWAAFAAVDALAGRQPVLLWVDDLHWADLATHEWLAHYAGLLAGQRLLLLSTARPDAAMSYAMPPSRFELAALPEAAAGRLVAQCDPAGRLSEAEQRSIVLDSAGVPLFIEHLARRHLAGEITPAHRIDELLALELDRLGAFKPVLQSAAVLGNVFSAEHLALILPHQELQPVLELATHYRLIRPLPQQRYAFRHALIRDAAYRSLTPGHARNIHARFAGWLAAQPHAAPGEIAAHFDAAQQWRLAIEWWRRAGQAALAGQFASDALRGLQRALALAEQHAAGEPVLLRGLQFAVGDAALLSQGYGSTLGHALFESIAARIEAQGRPEDDEDRFRALSGLYMGGSSQGRTEGLVIGRRLEQLADTPAKRLMVCFALGNSLFWRGSFHEALAYQQEGAALADTLPLTERTRYWGEDLGVLVRAFLSWNCWFLGDEAQARSVAGQGIAQARSGGKPHALCFVLAFAAAMNWTADDVEGTRRHAGEGLTLARRFGFPLWQGIHGLFTLWCDAREGRLADPAPVLQAAQTFRQAYQAGSTTAGWVVMTVLLQLDLHDELAVMVQPARSNLEQAGDLYCLAEVALLQAVVLARQGQAGQAALLLSEARGLAARQGAVGLAQRLERLAQTHLGQAA